MVQAKGVLPKGDDRAVLYRNPRTNGYFIGARLNPMGSFDELKNWLTSVDAAIAALVAPEDVNGQETRIASVAAGFSSTFFDLAESLGSHSQRPIGLTPDATPPTGWFPGCSSADFHALFYVASVTEARVAAFIKAIRSSGHVASLSLERGYQRPDESEPFGYRDGVRNVRSARRTKVVFVHTDGDQPDEPDWADGGTYMVTMKIIQNVPAFQALGDQSVRDSVIGRRPDGSRLDLPAESDPHTEPADIPTALPASSHVRKAGPRGLHDDVEIFRRGLPFFEVSNGQMQEGLLFCSFQANPAQFDTVFSDWMMGQNFPQPGSGTDALFNQGLVAPPTAAGLYFVPPHDDAGIAAAMFPPVSARRPRTGRLAIQKRVTNPSNPSERFERGGFAFHVVDQHGAVVPGSEFVTASSGRGVCPVELDLDASYTLVETGAPTELNVQLTTVTFAMDRPNMHLTVVNTTQQSGVYGGR